MAASEFIVYVTFPDTPSAEQATARLVEEKLVACCTLLPQARSVYRWKGEICVDREVLALLKTTGDAFEVLERRIRELHSYECPEIIAAPIERGSADYLQWLRESVAVGPGQTAQ